MITDRQFDMGVKLALKSIQQNMGDITKEPMLAMRCIYMARINSILRTLDGFDAIPHQAYTAISDEAKRRALPKS